MKCKIFWGCVAEAQDAFNKWAEGKALSRDVIIHELVIRQASDLERASIAIVVYHPEGAVWDSTKSKPIQRIQPEATEDYGLAREEERILTAPIHEEPEPHIKVEEAQATKAARNCLVDVIHLIQKEEAQVTQ